MNFGLSFQENNEAKWIDGVWNGAENLVILELILSQFDIWIKDDFSAFRTWKYDTRVANNFGNFSSNVFDNKFE